MLISLAWRNLWRHRKRTWITVAAVGLTTLMLVFMLSFQFGIYDTMKEQNLKLMDGYAQIQQSDFLEQPNLEHSFVYSDQWSSVLDKVDSLSAYGFRAQTYVILSNNADTQNRGALIMGVQPDKEPQLSSLAKKIISGRYLQNSDDHKIVLGKQLAAQLRSKVGDQVQLLGEDRDGSLAIDLYEIVGIADTHIPELNRQLAQITLSDFQILFAMPNRAQQLVFMTAEIGQAADLKPLVMPQLQSLTDSDLRFRNWQALQPALDQAIELDLSSAILWYAALLLIVILILLNTLYMSILERQNEFSLLNALGVQPIQISQILILEIVFTTLLGLISGVLLGMAVTEYFIFQGITLPGSEGVFAQFGLSDTLYPVLSLLSVGFAPAVFGFGLILLCAMVLFKMRSLKPLTGRQL
ncbi:ABC transporter permease [Thiomicrorhabdus heinhorstiae]|uniref:ABC transporter permease n=1 Tax=Thiomicrorhabdus heinhorstiae TaxID=2748010 RepID=A0ABS0BWH8_9GAMM|nr:FtsX-like permease family protein [Thiomicrorhabdus heinhorstiae]MBF6057759.1 ABC transporter permease [Thiomicrorhabdus heinhorstiae]